MDLSTLYKTQISLTEWLGRMGHKDADAHRKEDNDKRERLAVLNDLFGLPFDRPTQFPASEIAVPSPEFAEFLENRGDELCALRLIPHDSSMPKLRTRGASIRDSLSWFVEQKIDATKYKADFVPHAEHQIWATIFVVNKHGAFGQIVAGVHSQLTQGFYEEGTEPISFAWDGMTLQLNPANEEATKHIQTLIEMLRVKDVEVREKLVAEFGATFFGEILCGYFETTTSEQFGVWFIDWNRLLGEAYGEERGSVERVERSLRLSELSEGSTEEYQNQDVAQFAQGVTADLSAEALAKANCPSGTPRSPNLLHGNIGSRGTATGRARVIRAVDIGNSDLDEGDILITDMTMPDFLPLMQKASAVVTAWGGILSHAAIVCRELGKPCLTNVKGLFEGVKDGDMVEVNGDMVTVIV